MAKDSLDILMKVMRKGQALMAESRSGFIPSKSQALQSGFEEGRVCELRSFAFAVGTKSPVVDDPPTDDDADDTATKPAKPPKPIVQPALPIATASDVVDVQPVTFTRIMDAASTLLMTALVEGETLDSVSVIKRKAAGTGQSGETYLRLDFTGVLLIGLGWNDGENVVEENGSFIYRELTARYRPQKPDGSLGAVIQSVWKMTS